MTIIFGVPTSNLIISSSPTWGLGTIIIISTQCHLMSRRARIHWNSSVLLIITPCSSKTATEKLISCSDLTVTQNCHLRHKHHALVLIWANVRLFRAGQKTCSCRTSLFEGGRLMPVKFQWWQLFCGPLFVNAYNKALMQSTSIETGKNCKYRIWFQQNIVRSAFLQVCDITACMV